MFGSLFVSWSDCRGSSVRLRCETNRHMSVNYFEFSSSSTLTLSSWRSVGVVGVVLGELPESRCWLERLYCDVCVDHRSQWEHVALHITLMHIASLFFDPCNAFEMCVRKVCASHPHLFLSIWVASFGCCVRDIEPDCIITSKALVLVSKNPAHHWVVSVVFGRAGLGVGR